MPPPSAAVSVTVTVVAGSSASWSQAQVKASRVGGSTSVKVPLTAYGPMSQRHAPPGRTSSAQLTSSVGLGQNHCAISAGSVKCAQTFSGAAA